jgi:ABC-type sulfate/molybdate transport systems ATPase subunit
MHVVLSDSEEFASTFMEVIAGLRRPKAGVVRVDEIDPNRSPQTRRRIASVLANERILESRSVIESLRLEYALRQVNLEPTSVLGAWQLESWSSRDPSSLRTVEHRAVALASALSMPSPLALLAVVEPFMDHGGLPRDRLRQRLVEISSETCVVCATAVPRDAVELGGRVYLGERGRLTQVPAPVAEPLSALAGYFVVSAARPRDLVQALAKDPAVSGVQWAGSPEDQVLVWSPHGKELALAIVRAAHSSRCGVKSITPASPSHDLLQVAHAGWAQAVREQAWWLASATPGAFHGGPWRQA